MKLFIALASIFMLTASADSCSKKKASGTVYKARLEIKALCMNYTLTVLEGKIDTSLVASSWTDETTGQTYKNAFGLANPCDFPSTINKGDEFYFTIDTSKQKNCAICMAYYPTPGKKLLIKVVPK
jgi:hypothetical protein